MTTAFRTRREGVLAGIGAAVVSSLVASSCGLRPVAEEPQQLATSLSKQEGTSSNVTHDDLYLITSDEDLQRLPTHGSAWSYLYGIANSDWGSVDLADQDNDHAARVLAGAIVYARTQEREYLIRVEKALADVVDSPLTDARVLSVARQLGGYVLAADLVGYRSPPFETFVGRLRTDRLPGHDRWRDLTSTSEDAASNWGAWALASRAAVSLYVNDEADVKRVVQVFRGFLGDGSAYAGFRATEDFDPTWACPGTEWVPINPVGCGALSGAIVEDISRSGGSAPSTDGEGLMYSWETLGALAMTAQLLSRNGYPEVWQWSDRAILRAAQFLERNGGFPPDYSVNHHIPWMINAAYGVELGPMLTAKHGRQFGFTDWLYPRPKHAVSQVPQ